MSDINHVVLVGRLTRDAVLKHAASGMAICELSLAINRRVKQGEQWVDEPGFFDVTLFGKQGEAISQYLKKGNQVGIEGELRQDRWEKDGQKRSKVHVVANNAMLIGGRGEGGPRPGGSRPGGASAFVDDVSF